MSYILPVVHKLTVVVWVSCRWWTVVWIHSNKITNQRRGSFFSALKENNILVEGEVCSLVTPVTGVRVRAYINSMKQFQKSWCFARYRWLTMIACTVSRLQVTLGSSGVGCADESDSHVCTYRRRHWQMTAAMATWSSLAHSVHSRCFSWSRSVV